MRKEDHEAAMSALNHIRSSLSKYAIRKPTSESGEDSPAPRHVDPGPGDNSEDRMEANEDSGAERLEEESRFLTMDNISGEPEMPDGDEPNPEALNDAPPPSPMRMLEYGAPVSKRVAPGGTRPAAPAPGPVPVKRGRGRPRKVL